MKGILQFFKAVNNNLNDFLNTRVHVCPNAMHRFLVSGNTVLDRNIAGFPGAFTTENEWPSLAYIEVNAPISYEQ